MYGYVKEISYRVATEFLYPRHYSGRIPVVTKAFGLYSDETFSNSSLKAVCTFGKPASPSLCKGVCGDENSNYVYELNRLCRTDDWEKPLSQFVSACLRLLKNEDWIIVSYSDTGMNHHGYIYQACNFLYTGCTKQRTDLWAPNGKHSRHYNSEEQGKFRKVRTAKHRYIYFCTHKKALKKRWLQSLKYDVVPYPKGDNSEDYILGTYIKDIIVDCDSERNIQVPIEENLW